jgi:NADH:ubiquinone oxidoreductase subunit 6 (subunit J)
MGPTLVPKSMKAAQAKPSELSGNMTVVLVYITHGLVNAFLLCPWNPIRCAFWNRHECTEDEAWILNWLAFGNFHVCLLLSFLAYAAQGKFILEQRLVYLCAAIMLSSLSSGIFMMDQLNKPMAALQVIIYMGLLLIITYMTATAFPIVPLPVEIRSSSFDARRKLPISSVSLGLLFCLSSIRVLDLTFGSGRDSYLGDSSSPVYISISNAAVGYMMWSALILGFSIFLAAHEQQKLVLIAQVLALFVSQCMLAGEQGTKIEDSQLTAGGVGTFGAIVLALLGVF